jgi:hypothetical protein
MGDKSPKAKQRENKQKSSAKQNQAASQKSKQDSHNRSLKVAAAPKGKK